MLGSGKTMPCWAANTSTWILPGFCWCACMCRSGAITEDIHDFFEGLAEWHLDTVWRDLQQAPWHGSTHAPQVAQHPHTHTCCTVHTGHTGHTIRHMHTNTHTCHQGGTHNECRSAHYHPSKTRRDSAVGMLWHVLFIIKGW